MSYRLIVIAFMIAGSSTADASIQTIHTSFGSGADTELREDEDMQRGGARDLNTRREDPAINLEIIALRFDVSGINRSDILSATIETISTRSDSASDSGLEFWGLHSDVAGQNWTEGALNMPWNTANPFPGLIHDDDLSTFPIVAADTTTLGTLTWGVAPTQGAVLNFGSSSLNSFMQLGSGDLVTFFLFRTSPKSAQIRLTSKETENLGDTGTNPLGAIVSDTFAPRLVLEIRDSVPGAVPEASSAVIWVLLGVACQFRRGSDRRK